MSMSAIKARSRAAIHARAAEPCVHVRGAVETPSVEQSAEGLSLSVRFKSKMNISGGDNDAVSILESIESLIFNADQLEALALDLARGDEIVIEGYGITFVLDQPLEGDGPLNVYWTVVRDGA